MIIHCHKDQMLLYQGTDDPDRLTRPDDSC